jgi:lipopolysaccharide/colanic/teichoic acid biosynthesis glycosyltransferase
VEQRGLRLLVKRALDLAIAVPVAVAAAPVVTLAAMAIIVLDGRPAFFVQQRPGRHGRPFPFYKLRTMRPDSTGTARPDADAVRLTPIGKFLRETSIDELPQLWNVLRGDMSLVGPRPLLLDYLTRYTPEQARRHEVMPGITGWAALHGRNAQSWEEKFARDVWYVDHWTPWLDVEILARTVTVVLRRSDVNAAGHATSPEFTGP